MNLSSLRSLQARIREATGPDRELNADIAERLGGWKSFAGDNWIGPHGQICVPHYTTYPEGLGACVALLHERFPGARWARSPIGNFWVFAGERRENEVQAAPLANDCLTFIDAIIQAEVSKLETKEQSDA